MIQCHEYHVIQLLDVSHSLDHLIDVDPDYVVSLLDGSVHVDFFLANFHNFRYYLQIPMIPYEFNIIDGKYR